MGRTFENRKNAILKRGARDSKAFTKAGRQIAMAAKSGGGDPGANPTLRRALQNARAVNMPKDKIQKAIDKAIGAGSTDDYEQVLYEGFGPHGAAILVETATDNPTRTVANVRSYFKKCDGSLGNSGSVSFMFDQFGAFTINPEGLERDELELELIDAGLERLENELNDDAKEIWVAYCARENFGEMQSAFDARKIEVVSSGFRWTPKATTEITQAQADDVSTLFDKLEDDDDVQEVFCNITVAEAQ